jgi:hypothetical protein
MIAGAPDSNVAALAAEEASSAALLALGNASEAISAKEKADREQDERGAVKAAERKKQTNQHKLKRAEKWTAEDDATIMSMITGGSSCTEIALALGKGLKKDSKNRWNKDLKKSTDIIMPFVKQSNWDCGGRCHDYEHHRGRFFLR